MTKRENIIDKIISTANKNYPDSEIYLYGSRARGDSKKLSDWDILILLNREQISIDTETELMDDFYELELETGEIFSPLIYSKNDWNFKYKITPLYENIEKEGIKIK